MSEINVKVRLRDQTLYNMKIVVELEEPVGVLKKKICEKHEILQESLLEAVYCGLVMEDSHPICSYDVFRGATVHVFEKTQTEKVSPVKHLDKDDLVTFQLVICNLILSSKYRKSLMKHTSPEEIVNVISNVPGLAEDPVAISLLPHIVLIAKLGDIDVKLLAENHPALASAILYLNTVAHKETADMRNMGIVMWNDSDEDMEDTDDSLTASEISSLSMSRNSDIGTSTVAQPTSEITSVTNQQPQPSTSNAITSTTNTENPLHNLRNLSLGSPNPSELLTQIEDLSDRGLIDEAQQNSLLLQINNILDAQIRNMFDAFFL